MKKTIKNPPFNLIKSWLNCCCYCTDATWEYISFWGTYILNFFPVLCVCFCLSSVVGARCARCMCCFCHVAGLPYGGIRTQFPPRCSPPPQWPSQLHRLCGQLCGADPRCRCPSFLPYRYAAYLLVPLMMLSQRKVLISDLQSPLAVCSDSHHWIPVILFSGSCEWIIVIAAACSNNDSSSNATVCVQPPEKNIDRVIPKKGHPVTLWHRIS